MLLHRNVWSRLLVLVGGALLLSCAKEDPATSGGDAVASIRATLAVAPGWTGTAPMASARARHAAVLLGSGKLLVIGGVNSAGSIATAELHDPATNTWTSAGASGIQGTVTHAVLLPDGRVLALVDGSATGRVHDPVTGAWTDTGAMSGPRGIPSVTLLESGRVLVAGGASSGSWLATAELYDPATNTFTPTGSMTGARGSHSATRLRDGRVLAVSGFSGSGEVAGADLYNPATGTWSAAAPPLVPRHYSTSTLLPDGRVLVAGGFTDSGVTAHAELYDPAANTWTATGGLAFARFGHAATLLPDGRVLVTGGSLANQAPQQVSEVYDPATGLWSPAGTMLSGRDNHTATLLPSGKVLAVGGANQGTNSFSATTELYDPGVNAWAPAGTFSDAPTEAVVALLPTGRVLVAGGRNGGGVALASARLYDVPANTWTPAASLSAPRERATATVLRSGVVLVIGGQSGGASVATTERYDATTNTWSPAASLAGARHQHSATLLADGRVLVVGGQRDATVLGTVELHDAVANTWTPVAGLATPRSGHAAVLLPDGRVLVAGGRDGGGAALASGEVYDPASNTWAPAASLAQGREGLTLTLLPSGRALAAGGLSGAAGLASTELYDASTNTWTAGPALSQAHGYHTATLAPSGKVLVAGGLSAPATPATTAEVYDTSINDWTVVSAPSVSGGIVAAALPSGEVLLAGGTAATSAERYEDTGSQPAWRPVVSQPEVLTQTCPVTLQGQRFRGISGGSGGNAADSPTDFPLVRLRSAEGGRLWTLPATAMSATNATVTVPADVPPGPYALSVFANAIPGGRMVTVVPNTAPTAQAQTLVTTTGAPVAVTLAATDPDAGQTLTWTIVTPPQHGTLSGTPPNLTYTPNPGYTGADSFTFQVRDCGQDSNVATVDVDVSDAPAPVITCPANTVIEATGPNGAPGSWPPATATGTQPPPTITYSPPEGTTLPLGTTTITATATDASGVSVSCTFDVTVRDTTAPTVTCPADIEVASQSASGTTVTYDLPPATDAVSSPTVTASPPSGSTFPPGTTRVTVTATDAAGNSAQCTFNVSARARVVSIAGGGCQSTGEGTASALALLLAMASWAGVRRRSRTRVQSGALVALLAVLLAPAARAQGTGAIIPIDLERLRFVPGATDSMLVDTGHVLNEGGYRLSLMAGYERGILLLEGSDGVERDIIDYRFAGWLAGAWSPVDRLELSARLPVIITQGGDGADQLVGVAEPKSFGLGTPEVGVRYALLRREDGAPVFLGLGLDVGLPGGTASAFGRMDSWAGFQVAPRVAVGREVGPVFLGANAGVRIRAKEVEPGRDFGTELEQGLVVATRGEGLRGEIALQAAESLVEPDVALELLGGLRLPVGKGFEAFALAGHGFTDIPGTPSLRINAGIAWAHNPPSREREDPCEAGRSHTPSECPELDDDGDSVPNGEDRCPTEAGAVENGGCPDRDSDGDGVVDRQDACPNERGSERHKGCPAPDKDGDGVPDEEDACPDEAGTAENRGCPVKEEKPAEPPPAEPKREEPPPAAEPSPVPTDHHVLFPLGQYSLEESEKRQLDVIANYLKAHPELSVRVEGHTDSTGPEELNRTLSQQRADMVRQYLIERGVPGSRMVAKGYGPDRPVRGNSTPEEQRENRRVEFITKPSKR
ncbi:OmpA family protein [Pyxidicoccus fallax]|uniref:OmpA family protein n=1 Tax=Pyxidicoccus fallax TaxID=394095 RepID=A0A848L969_9BACT|nr:kelch repeat-containing protein [Pyxidicoccus fallax]NMO15107.1 OmpA family protein [Pyxidicoccus fallax]NPC81798.1 OmpA family protein [Pyxidicoccus fallax]